MCVCPVQSECLQEPETAVCRCSTKKVFKFHRKARLLESFFNKVAEPAKPSTLIKGDSNTGVFL